MLGEEALVELFDEVRVDEERGIEEGSEGDEFERVGVHFGPVFGGSEGGDVGELFKLGLSLTGKAFLLLHYCIIIANYKFNPPCRSDKRIYKTIGFIGCTIGFTGKNKNDMLCWL